MKTKILIDTSVIASSLEIFKKKFVESGKYILVLSDLNFKELEARKHDKYCNEKFARYLISLFVEEPFMSSTELAYVDAPEEHRHYDENIVKYAKEHNLSVLTCDKGMALHCRFQKVPYELLGIFIPATKFDFIYENNGFLCINFKNRSIPSDTTILLYDSKTKNRLFYSNVDGIQQLKKGDILLIATTQKYGCEINEYIVNDDCTISHCLTKIYNSKEEARQSNRPYHKELYNRWTYVHQN